MHTVTLEHARAHFDVLVDEAAGGEEILIEDSHRPLVRLVAAVSEDNRRMKVGEWLAQARERPAPKGLSTDGLLKENRSEV